MITYKINAKTRLSLTLQQDWERGEQGDANKGIRPSPRYLRSSWKIPNWGKKIAYPRTNADQCDQSQILSELIEADEISTYCSNLYVFVLHRNQGTVVQRAVWTWGEPGSSGPMKCPARRTSSRWRTEHQPQNIHSHIKSIKVVIMSVNKKRDLFLCNCKGSHACLGSVSNCAFFLRASFADCLRRTHPLFPYEHNMRMKNHFTWSLRW